MYCYMRDREATSCTATEAQEQLILYAIQSSVWPTNSLLDKFRRLCDQNEVRYICPAGYRGKPKILASYYAAITSERSIFVENAFLIFLVVSS